MDSVFFAFDENYFVYANALIKSLNDYNTNAHCFCCNLSQKSHAKLKEYRNVCTIKSNLKHSNKTKITVMRFVWFNEFLKKNKHINKAILIDDDAIVKKDVSAIFQSFDKYDIVFDYDHRRATRHKIQAGFLFVKNNHLSNGFFDKYTKKAKKKEMKWGLDQRLLYEVFCEYSDKIKWSALPKGIHSVKMLDDSYVYQARGKRKNKPIYMEKL